MSRVLGALAAMVLGAGAFATAPSRAAAPPTEGNGCVVTGTSAVCNGTPSQAGPGQIMSASYTSAGGGGYTGLGPWTITTNGLTVRHCEPDAVCDSTVDGTTIPPGPTTITVTGAEGVVMAGDGGLQADRPAEMDCSADLGDPAPGSPEWETAHHNTRFCRTERIPTTLGNPAYHAAVAANASRGSARGGEPFRDVSARWAGRRGDHREVTWTDREGVVHRGSLFSPLDADGGPYPGIIWPCHTCALGAAAGQSPAGDLHVWVPQVLAEHGYLVFFPDIFYNNVPATFDAIDWFLSNEANPSPRGEVNPWHDRVDSSRLGLVGHSGAAGVSLTVGNSDDRVDAVVGWDPAGPNLEGLTLTTPSMIQVADLDSDEVPTSKPEPESGSKYTYFDAFRTAGVDTMQIAIRASTHADWLGTGCASPGGFTQYGGCSFYGEQVATYYTLAWFDRYLRGASEPTIAAEALTRLTATDTFDGSSDVHSIGTGRFEPSGAATDRSVEAGNVPITLEGLTIRNRLSFWYPSGYFFDGGALSCDDLRAGCSG